MVVSRSDADTFSSPSSISNKKLSSIGRELLVLNTPEMLCKCFKSEELETIKFMIRKIYPKANESGPKAESSSADFLSSYQQNSVISLIEDLPETFYASKCPLGNKHVP
jgi:hypothetical protein